MMLACLCRNTRKNKPKKKGTEMINLEWKRLKWNSDDKLDKLLLIYFMCKLPAFSVEEIPK